MVESLLPVSQPDPPPLGSAISYEIDLCSAVPLFEQQYPEIFDLFYKVGIHPTKPSTMPSLYLSRSFAPHRPNIGLHSIGVALCAQALALALGTHPGTPGVNLDIITRRALLHDVGKPFELMRRDTRNDAHSVYSHDAYGEVYRLLLNAGMSELDAETVVTSGVDAGHLSVRRFLYVDRNGDLRIIAGNVPGKIIHLADSLVLTTVPTDAKPSQTTLLTPRSRILSGEAKQRYPWLWDMGLGLDGDREIVEIPDIRSSHPGVSMIGSYAAVLAWAAKSISTEFVARCRLPLVKPFALSPDPIDPEEEIVDIVRYQIENQAAPALALAV